MTRHRLAPVFILLAAAFTRLFRLTRLGLEHDEVANWLIDRSILDQANHAIYYTEAYGHEAGFHYLQSLSILLLGDNAFALRLPAVFLGILGVAVSYALAQTLFNRRMALVAATIIAVTFFPAFYSRLALRAIMLPVFSGLSAVFFWQALKRPLTNDGRPTLPLSVIRYPLPIIHFLYAAIFAGLSAYTYMASRAVPIFYAAFIIYIAIFYRDLFKRKWRGIALFAGVYAVIALPLVLYLRTNPGSEFRISEIDAPLRALLAGDIQPVLNNAWKILLGFGWQGDPLWRQNVAFRPIFNPFTAILFYAGLVIAIRKWRLSHVFILLWAATAIIPSLVTVDAPSTIRMINILPVLGIFPAIVMHSLIQLSTNKGWLSTALKQKSWITLLTIIYIWGNSRSIYYLVTVWPNGGDVPFVWQTALTDIAEQLKTTQPALPTTVVGWSPDTMDAPTMTLALNGISAELRHTAPPTAILPIGSGDQFSLALPAIPPLNMPDLLQGVLEDGAVSAENHPTFNLLTFDTNRQPLIPQHPIPTKFADELTLLGYTLGDCTTANCQLLTFWRVETVPTAPRHIFVHALAADGMLVAQSDGLDAPTQFWQSGDLIIRQHQLSAETPIQTITTGVYEPIAPFTRLQTDSSSDHIVLIRLDP